MPIVSQAQRGAMYAAAQGNSTLDIPKGVAQEFVASDEGGKLPARVGDKKKKKPVAAPMDYGGLVAHARKFG